MASSGYSAQTFVAGEMPTTAKWNLLWSNDQSFNSGNGFNDGILMPRHFSNNGTPNTSLDTYVAWTSYTPTWTAFTVGNGTVNAKFQQVGKTVNFKIDVIAGSTTAATASVVVSLPVPAAALVGAAEPAGLTNYNGFFGPFVLNNTTSGIIRWYQLSGSGIIQYNIGPSSPSALSAGSEVHVFGSYEAA